MTEQDQQLIEEYSKEIFGDLYTPECKITISQLIEHSRKLREINSDDYWNFRRVDIDALKLLTIQQLANLIGTDD